MPKVTQLTQVELDLEPSPCDDKTQVYGIIIITVQLVLPKVSLFGGRSLLFLQSYFSQINCHNAYHVVRAQ